MAYSRRTNIRLSEAMDRYLERITAEGQSEKSVRTAYYNLKRFKKFVRTTRCPDPYVHEITVAMCDDYCYGEGGIRQGHYGKPISSVTFNRYRSVIFCFFKYAVRMAWTDHNPMLAVDPARPDPEKERLRLNAGELMALLDHCHLPVERIGCALGMHTGLRSNDIKRLTVFDASLASGEIQTEIRKTRKYDVKPISAELHVELENWLNLYAQLTGLPDRSALPNDWLLMPSYLYVPARPGSKSGREVFRLKPTTVHSKPWQLVQRPLARMGYPTYGEGFHTLRRSVARCFFESLRDSGEARDHALLIVKDFLNHSSVVQTEKYLGLNQERTIRNQIIKDKPFLSAMAEREQARVAPKLEVARLVPEREAVGHGS